MLRALLVDDDEIVRSMLAKFLERAEFSVVTASSASAGIAILAGEQFDIVITDLKMESPLAGFEVVRAARQVVPRPLIVVLTAFPVPKPDWQDSGADALFVKGENILAFPKQVKALLAGRASS